MEVFVYPHKDLVSCTNMSLNASSSLALLAGRRCYAVVDLTSPSSLVYKEARQSKWEVVCSEWSVQEEKLLAVASNNKVELLTCTDSELVPDTVLRAHTRVITDLAWHTHDRQLLATSSADNYIYLWDMRDLRRPKAGLQAVQGAAKVEWNKVSGKYLASAHDGEIKLWDIRNSSSPVQYINAHLSRIYSMDWSWDHEDCLATSSQDATVQFWNLASPSKAENAIKTSGAPVWQLQHTPFGSGLLTLVMHTVLRGENNLVLWNRTDLRAPIHTFYGHTDMVLNFGWSSAKVGDCRTRLVTWSKDGTLRLWDMDAELQRRCGQDVEETEELKNVSSRETFFDLEEFEESPPQTLEEVMVASPPEPGSISRVRSGDSESEIAGPVTAQSMNLNKEFRLLNVSDKLQVVAQDAKERIFTVSAETSKNVLILHVKFPPNYPMQKAPVFSFLNGTTVDNLITRSSMLNKVRAVAKKEINHNRRCLEPCLRQFEASVAVLEEEEQLQLQLNNPQLTTALHGGFHDHNIPFPRSSGARFCGDGHLVTFGWTRQYNVPVASVSRDETDGPMDDLAKTPRALTAMIGVPLSSGATSPKYSVQGMCSQSPSQESSYFPFKARVSRVRFSNQKNRISIDDSKTDRKSSIGSQKGSSRENTRTITIYLCSDLLPRGCKQLASSYILPGVGRGSTLSLQEVCDRNASSALVNERPDLVQLWSLAALSSGGREEGGLPWAQHPMGRRMLEDMMQHYLKLKDIQTVAVLSAVFSNPAPSIASAVGRKKHSLPDMRRLDTTYDVLLARANSENGEEAENGSILRKLSSNGWEDEERRQADYYLLDPVNNSTYDVYIKIYADLLYKWRMLGPRAELMKCLSQETYDGSYATKYTHFCPKCRDLSPGPSCTSCRALLLQCAVCRVSCRGLTCVCPSCGHGGHTAHLRDWFATQAVCPTGCGCSCPAFISV